MGLILAADAATFILLVLLKVLPVWLGIATAFLVAASMLVHIGAVFSKGTTEGSIPLRKEPKEQGKEI